MRWIVLAIGFACGIAVPAFGQDVNITKDTATRSFELNGVVTTISRIQDQENHLTGDFTKTSRACPPFCITPITVAPGVATIGELEVMDFLETEVSGGTGLLIDSRLPEWFAKGSIPGSVNVPFNTLDSTNPYRDEILKALGARQSGSGWDYADAMALAIYCNGPWCEQSPRAIHSLLGAGYPAEKLKYYRGGMQSWLLLGLTTHN